MAESCIKYSMYMYVHPKGRIVLMFFEQPSVSSAELMWDFHIKKYTYHVI